MEQAAVRVVALELDLERRGEVEGLGSLDEAGLDVVGLGDAVGLAQLLAILVLDLLAVVVDESLLLDVAVDINGAGGRAVLVGSHIGRWWCGGDQAGETLGCRCRRPGRPGRPGRSASSRVESSRGLGWDEGHAPKTEILRC